MSLTERMTDGKQLAGYRVYREDGHKYMAQRMDTEQISERRSYLRKALRNFPRWENLPNGELDNIRLFTFGDRSVVEDGNGYEFILPSVRVSGAESDFRRIRAMMPFEFMDLTGRDFDWGRYKADISGCKDMVNRYIMRYPEFKEKGMGLYIYSGTKGSGKTMLSCCLLNEIPRRYSGSVKFVNILDFLEMTKKGFSGDDGELQAVYGAGLLVLDDIGVQMSREWVETVLYRLVNHRYTQRLPTVYTSNIPVDGLKMDDRITDRIDSTTYSIRLPEESIRREMRQQEKQQLLDEMKNAP